MPIDDFALFPRTSRRAFLRTSALGLAGAACSTAAWPLAAQEPGERPARPDGVEVLNPRGRVPVSLIIDDSTCLVNMGHFCMPQFAEAWPDRQDYQKPWQTFPREIPDSFVRKFGEWCRDHGVKGKYSVVPYPACVGWLDRDLPGWSKRQLDESLALVRDFLAPDWDFHPEMVSHTWVIDTKTGRPYEERSPRFMENWAWTDGKSVDQLADYMSYALRILKNVGLSCEGITTPGGFGNRVLNELSQATLEACRDVYQTEIPHYFRHLYTDERSVAPRVEYASGLDGGRPQCVVSIIGCTGDWFGGWDGTTPGSVDQFITQDLRHGRLPDVIARGEPAVLVCHWPGIYYNGDELGFNIFKQVVERLDAGFDNLVWMKLSEIARYWAAKELTRIARAGDQIVLEAPFACAGFTLRAAAEAGSQPRLELDGKPARLKRVERLSDLAGGTWFAGDSHATLCFDLPRGTSQVSLA
ncbi:MAG: hypothetical protein WD847_05565 [Pirellulales bacterium]